VPFFAGGENGRENARLMVKTMFYFSFLKSQMSPRYHRTGKIAVTIAFSLKNELQ